MQCSKAASEANKRLGMIKRNFRFKSRSVMLPLYKSIVRPHLDHCVQAGRIMTSSKRCRGGLQRWLRGWTSILMKLD